MRIVPVAIAKLNPEHWERIKVGTQHFDIRSEDTDSKTFFYVHPKTGEPLGAARVITRTCLTRVYKDVLSELNYISEAQVENLFMDGGGYVYSYQIEPYDTLAEAVLSQASQFSGLAEW